METRSSQVPLEAPIDWNKIHRLRSLVAAPRLKVREAHLDEAKLVEYRFGGFERLEISHLTDLQYGSRCFRRDRFLRYRDWILEAPYRYVVLGGDLIDAATVLSVANPFDNVGEPIDQVREVVALLEPLAPRLLAYVGGNHERRTIRTFGDCGRLIASGLGVPYSRGVQLINIHFGRHRPFKMSLWHGSGSARTKGARAQMLHRFMQQADSQCYLVGHHHDVVLLLDWRQVRTDRGIRLEKVAGVMSSSFMDYWNSYAETMALPPSDAMMACVVLHRNGAWEVTLR